MPSRPSHMGSGLRQTTFLIPSIHCPTCTDFIESLLLGLDPAPDFVSTSIVNHSVTIWYGDKVDMNKMAKTLTDAGYEVDSAMPEDDAEYDLGRTASTGPSDDNFPLSWAGFGGLVNTPSRVDEDERLRRHMKNCSECRDGSPDTPDIIPSEKQKPHIVIHDSSTPQLYEAIMSLDGMSCASCVGRVTAVLEERPWVQSAAVSLLARTATVRFFDRSNTQRLADIVDSVGYDAKVEEVRELQDQEPATDASKPDDDLWRASFSVSGMTCSACVGNITREIEGLPWTRTVDVNLISGSMTVVFKEKSHLADIASAIDDLGYVASLSDVVAANAPKTRDSRRHLSVRVEGLYCSHCPGRITSALAARFGHGVVVEKLPTLGKPLVTLSYIPAPPELSVRSILESISETDPAFSVSIYHPPTVEERARQMMRRTRLRIFLRVLACFVIAIPTLIIGIVYMNLVSHHDPNQRYLMEPLSGVSRADWALLVLATPVYFFCADIFHRRTVKEIHALWRPGSPVPILRRFYRFGSMDMLVSFATSIAYFSSIAELILAATAPESHHGKIPAHLDAVVFLTFFLLTGRMIEAYSKAKTGEAVSKLGSLRPREALLLVPSSRADGALEPKSVAIDMLDTGDLVRVVHGASPPWDGILIEGKAEFMESSLTGESRPVAKQLGDAIYSGTVNKGGPITIRLTGASGESLLDSIIKVVREGQARRAPIERVADAITGYFVPVVTLIAITTWLTWLGLGLSGRLPEDYRDAAVGGWPFWSLQFAIAVFVIACPCGIGLAAPTALFVGGGLAAKHGILAKGGGEAFQEASKLNIVVFDKTGTLTEGGEPKLTNHRILSGEGGVWSEEAILGMLGELEGNSSHPIAKAIVTFSASKVSGSYQAEQVEEIPGKGIRGILKKATAADAFEVIAGNEAFMADCGVDFGRETLHELDVWKDEAKSVVLAAGRLVNVDGSNSWVALGTFAVSDAVRPEAQPVLEALRNEGIDVWMISGDNERTAQAVGSMLGIPSNRVMAGVLPEQKAEKIQYLQKSQITVTRFLGLGRPSTTRPVVAMVGDGVNDSPALTVADVGIAIGSGSDVAISAADFVLVNANLTTLLTLTRLSRAVFRRVKFNFGWALVYNLVALPVAAGVLYPIKTNGGYTRLDPVWAALAMALSSVSVITSSLLLRAPLPIIGFTARSAQGTKL